MKTFNMHDDEAARLQRLQDHVNRQVGAKNKTYPGWYGKNDVLKLLLDMASRVPLQVDLKKVNNTGAVFRSNNK